MTINEYYNAIKAIAKFSQDKRSWKTKNTFKSLKRLHLDDWPHFVYTKKINN